MPKLIAELTNIINESMKENFLEKWLQRQIGFLAAQTQSRVMRQHDLTKTYTETKTKTKTITFREQLQRVIFETFDL